MLEVSMLRVVRVVGLVAVAVVVLVPAGAIAQTAGRSSSLAVLGAAPDAAGSIVVPVPVTEKAKTDTPATGGVAGKKANAGKGEAQPKPMPTAPPKAKPSKLSRWFELQTGTVAARYRSIINSKGVQTSDQLQDSGQFKARVKFDAKGRVSVNAVYATGSNFTGGWNNSGVGTGDAFTHWYLKQFFVAAVPMTGVEVSFGGIGFSRGDSTEITTWDNDAYLSGGRLSVKRPKDTFFDELGITSAYLGDLTTPSITDRYKRLSGERNFYQYFASKKLSKDLSVSADYSRYLGVPSLHVGITAKTAPLYVVDMVRLEQYSRYGTKGGTGFALYGEKAIGKRITAGVGYADIDKDAPTLNADRFARGKRFYETASVKLPQDLTLQLFVTQAVHNQMVIPNRNRVDVVLSYNALSAFQRMGLFR